MKSKHTYLKLLLVAISLFSCVNDFSQQEVTLKVHFLHGSKPLKNSSSKEDKWFGGLHGGHVGVEVINGEVFSFYPSGKFHYFPSKKNINSSFKKESLDNFYSVFGDYDSVKRTIIYIPITKDQKEMFDSLSSGYINKPPYDYAFLGMRCASASYDVLAVLGILKQKSRKSTSMNIFYPKVLRRKLIKEANRKKWLVEYYEGVTSRKWEK